MKDLSRHIEFLLLDHDCVIYPQLGAFIAKYIPSRWVEEEDLFLPPYRSICFNELLKEGDDLFVTTLAKRYKITLNEARVLCADFLDFIHQELTDNGSVDLGSIGMLTQDQVTGKISFSPCIAGVTTPELYGLDVCHMTPTKLQTVEETQKATEKKVKITSVQADEKSITIRINRSLFNYVAAVAASVVLFFSLSSPVVNTGMSEEQMAEANFFIPQNLTPYTIGKETEAEFSKPVLTETVPTENVQEDNISTNKGKYAIVLASALSQKNAERYIENLKKRGYKAEIQNSKKLIRVIISGFNTQEEVQTKIKEMKQSSSEFSKIWTPEL